MKIVHSILAGALVMTTFATAQADHNRGPDSYLARIADDARASADFLTQVLARGGRANTQLIFNSGLVAKEANDLVQALNGYGVDGERYADPDQEYRDVLNAWQPLNDNYRYAGRHTTQEDQAFRQLDSAIFNLRDAYQGGGNDGRDGNNDGRDGSIDGRDGGGDWGNGDGSNNNDGGDGGGNWGGRP